jgi:hypothetical protein
LGQPQTSISYPCHPTGMGHHCYSHESHWSTFGGPPVRCQRNSVAGVTNNTGHRACGSRRDRMGARHRAATAWSATVRRPRVAEGRSRWVRSPAPSRTRKSRDPLAEDPCACVAASLSCTSLTGAPLPRDAAAEVGPVGVHELLISPILVRHAADLHKRRQPVIEAAPTARSMLLDDVRLRSGR